MKFITCALLVAFAACAVEGAANWRQKTKNLETRFEATVNRKASQAVSDVKSAEKTLKKDVYKFFQFMESKINSTVANAIKDIDILKEEVSLQCYTNATKDMVTVQEAALANLFACQNMSKAYLDIEKIAQQAQPIVLDIVADAKVIIQGIAECGTDAGLAQWKCAFKYVSKEIQNLISQWPEAKRFILAAEQLGSDVKVQVRTCLNAPSQVALEKKIKEAMAEFSACSQQTINKH